MPIATTCICAQSIIGTMTYVASARRLTDEAMPYKEQTTCRDRLACGYRALMAQVKEGYHQLGITMQRLCSGTIVSSLGIIDPDLDSDSEDDARRSFERNALMCSARGSEMIETTIRL